MSSNLEQKSQADNEGTEPPSAQHRLNLDLNPILRMLCKSYKKIKAASGSASTDMIMKNRIKFIHVSYHKINATEQLVTAHETVRNTSDMSPTRRVTPKIISFRHNIALSYPMHQSFQ